MCSEPRPVNPTWGHSSTRCGRNHDLDSALFALLVFSVGTGVATGRLRRLVSLPDTTTSDTQDLYLSGTIRTAKSSPRPDAPFLRWPVQHHDPRFGFAWYADPATFVCQLQITHGDVSAAEGINDALDRVILGKRDEIAAAGGLLVIQDFRAAKSYTSEARKAFVERLKKRPRGYSRGVYVAVGVNPLLRMAVQTVNIAFTMTIGGAIKLVTDPLETISHFRVQTPGPKSRFP